MNIIPSSFRRSIESVQCFGRISQIEYSTPSARIFSALAYQIVKRIWNLAKNRAKINYNELFLYLDACKNDWNKSIRCGGYIFAMLWGVLALTTNKATCEYCRK